MAKKTRKPRRELVGGLITHLSFVDRGANRVLPVLKAKNDGNVEIVAQIAKYNQREHLLYALVYGPDFLDAHEDFAKADVVKHYCHNFLRPGGGNIDTMHNDINVEGVHVAENTIIQKGDRRFDTVDYDGNPVDTEGWWGVALKIENEEIEAKCASGEFGGLSMGGRRVLVRPVDTKNFTSALACRLGSDNSDKELDMDEKTLAELFKAAVQPLADAVANIQKSLEPKQAAPEPKPEEKPVLKFTGDPTDLEALAKHEDNVFLASCDLGTPVGIKKWRDYLEAKNGTEKPVDLAKAEKDLADAKAAQASAEKKITELRKASTQNTGDEVKGDETILEKRQRIRENAREMAKKHNEKLGRK